MKKNASPKFSKRLRNWFAGQWRALRRLEKDDLDLSRAGQWPDLLKIMALLMIILGVILISHWLLLGKNREQLNQISREQESLYENYRIRSFQAANLSAYQTQMRSVEETFERLLSRLPVDNEVPRLLDDIQRAASRQRLELQLMSLQNPQAQEFYSELSFEIRVRGEYHRLAAFMAEISSLERIITLHDFTLQPIATGSSTLELAIQARTYRYDQSRENGQASNGGRP